jgi:hypothetical protein
LSLGEQTCRSDRRYAQTRPHYHFPSHRLSILALVPLVYVEQLPSKTNENGYSNAYRIVGIDPYNHRGTRGRETNESDAPISYADVLR